MHFHWPEMLKSGGRRGVLRNVALRLSRLKGRKRTSDQALQLFMAASLMEPGVDRRGSCGPINIPTPASLCEDAAPSDVLRL